MQIICGQCRNRLKVDDDKAGRTLTCPKCGHKIPLPHLGAEAAETPPPDGSHLPADDEGFVVAARQAMEKTQRVSITCGQCGRHLKVGARLSGMKARCPSCKGLIRIPWPDDAEDFQFPPLREEAEADVVDIQEGDYVYDLTPEEEHRLRRTERRVRVFVIAASVLAAALIATPFAVRYYNQLAEKWARRPEPTTSETTQVAASRPETQPATGIASTQAVPEKGVVRFVTAAREMFACGGYFPARPGQVYWRVTVEVRAGWAPANFNAHGEDVSLAVGDQVLPSLGLAAGDSLPPVRAEEKEVHLKAEEARNLTLLFEAPQAATKGRVAVRGVGEADFAFAGPTSIPSEEALAGEYAEEPPRNLRPLLRDRVMAAIQSAPDQKMIVLSADEGFEVSIPAANVSGKADPISEGLYSLVLKQGGDSLDAKLRLIENGKRLILYLSEEPFHQLTYARQ